MQDNEASVDPCLFGTHSLRRTKATLIYRRTGNLRAVQLFQNGDILPTNNQLKRYHLPVPSTLWRSGAD